MSSAETMEAIEGNRRIQAGISVGEKLAKIQALLSEAKGLAWEAQRTAIGAGLNETHRAVKLLTATLQELGEEIHEGTVPDVAVRVERECEYPVAIEVQK
jgi:hypothetical protein